MKFKDKYNISNEFDDIFTFNNEEEELEHDAQMLMYRFLEEVEKCHEGGPKFKKKDLADALGKSPSFISQLYSGDKLLSFPLLAKIQKALRITFEIKAQPNSIDYQESASNVSMLSFQNEPDGYWVWMNKNPDYSKPDDCCNTYEAPNKNITAA